MPLEVLNLEAVHVQYETLTTKGRLAEQEITIPLQTETDLAYRIPLKVRDSFLPPQASSGGRSGRLLRLMRSRNGSFHKSRPFICTSRWTLQHPGLGDGL